MKLIRPSAEHPNGDHIEPVELIDWLSQGESCSLQIGETSVVVRFIGRKGRRARIAVSATQLRATGRSTKEAALNEE